MIKLIFFLGFLNEINNPISQNRKKIQINTFHELFFL